MDDEVDQRAQELLRRLTGRVDAVFHTGQLEAIRALAVDRARVLVVQRTGWGKSGVYFIATRLLRDAGSGPTLLLSPLLALMRNQIEAARRVGVRAETINSANPDEWDEVLAAIEGDEVDLLMISPERLANRRFRESILDQLGQEAGLLVVDEAHCISDWGHDFRPDYRRIRRILDLLPSTIPILACTATANDRVVDDVVSQLGEDLQVFRGPLARDGLALHVIDLPSAAARMAWLAKQLPTFPGSGIVYCLTKRDAEVVAAWLRHCGVIAASYTGASDDREIVEQALLDNTVQVVVATSALGMGFDKPDLAYVIHYQSPGSVITYYQQVGRAGRQLPTSTGVLLRGGEDSDIQDWFVASAFPTAEECAQVLEVLEQADGFVKLAAIEESANVRPSRIQNLMKNLEVDGAVVADGQQYQRTPRPFSYDAQRVGQITALRREEQREMREYASQRSGCRMLFLGRALDDPRASPCGICDLCGGAPFPSTLDEDRVGEAARFVRCRPNVVVPRKQWPDRSRILPSHQLAHGRALCRWGDGGWSHMVKQDKHRRGRFDPQLVTALVDLVREWHPDPSPEWVTWVPSLRHPDLVPDLARRLADELGLPSQEAIAATRPTRPQKAMQNSAQQLANVEGSYAVSGPVPLAPVLLVDDIVDSRWTLTHIGLLLRQAGCAAVTPLVLGDRGQS